MSMYPTVMSGPTDQYGIYTYRAGDGGIRVRAKVIIPHEAGDVDWKDMTLDPDSYARAISSTFNCGVMPFSSETHEVGVLISLTDTGAPQEGPWDEYARIAAQKCVNEIVESVKKRHKPALYAFTYDDRQ